MEKCWNACAAWKQAHANAREMETTLARAWRLHSARLGDPPTVDLLRQLSQRRADADAKLQAALAEIEFAKHGA